MTKWKRLFNALAQEQNRTQSGDRVLAFIRHALEPARYQGDSARLEERRDRVNVTLLLYDGLKFGLECELLDRSRFPTPADARGEVFGFIEGFYNTRRIHSALGYTSPANFERLNHAA